MKTFFDVAVAANLQGRTRERFLEYMLARWKAEEETQCQTGYATEWAIRFRWGEEYQASDSIGQAILRAIDRRNR